MLEPTRIPELRKITISIDSYQEGILRGRLFGPGGKEQSFASLSQLLVNMEQHLSAPIPPCCSDHFSGFLRSSSLTGALATFDLQILFRQHSSWQGRILWREQHKQQPFRSVLELILIMDRILGQQEKEAVG